MRPERAWFKQARSDLRTAQILEENGADVCQIVLHLQMCGEKLIKGYIRKTGPTPRIHGVVHNNFAIVRALIVADPRLRTLLMGRPANRREVVRVLRSLEASMRRVELLNPSLAGPNAPNCEYPWETGNPPVGHPPVAYRFGNAVGKAARVKLYRLLDRILLSERV